jgi:hypothetical protein
MPPPDADGNPPCPVQDGWEISATGRGISVFYWSDGPDHVAVLVRAIDGIDRSQAADIPSGEEMHQFTFQDVDPSAVQHVLIMASAVRCFALPGLDITPR